MLCLEAKRRGAARVVGVDSDPHYVHAAQQLAARSALNAEYMQLDLNRFDFNTFSETFGVDQFDIVFCCSMIENLTNAGGFSRSLAPHIAHTYYLEGHSADGAREVQRYRGYLESMGFASVQTLQSSDSGQNAPGELNGRTRPAFRGQRT
jgi:threonine dehydrogenase-like Zn-dependent dehydrogenase